MRRLLRTVNDALTMSGIDLRRLARSLHDYPGYRRDLRTLKSQASAAETLFPLGRMHPCLGERSSDSGEARGHYFHQDLLVARRIHEKSPERHVDVGSRVDGFVAHVASFRPIEVLDIRPLAIEIPNVTFTQADLMNPVGASLRGYCDSISCLHALEHFGLGRYGDPVRYDGYLIGLANLGEILKTGGTFYLSVPIGPQRIEFNAHRVFSLGCLLSLVEKCYAIDRFSFVDDCGDLHENVRLTDAEVATNFGCTYGCAILEMTKLS